MFNKIIKYYVVRTIDCPQLFLTVATKKKQCQEYIVRHFSATHKESYLAWLRKAQLKDSLDAQKLYYEKLAPTNYKIDKIKYTTEGLSSIVRMFSKCVPLGASYIPFIEIAYWDSEQTKAQEAEKQAKANDDLKDVLTKMFENAVGMDTFVCDEDEFDKYADDIDSDVEDEVDSKEVQ